jgi:hypothetical protein
MTRPIMPWRLWSSCRWPRSSAAWPAPEALLIKFVAQHLWDPARRETDAAHGMPDTVAVELRRQGLLRADGRHAPATVQRRLTSWSNNRPSPPAARTVTPLPCPA